MRVHPVTRLSFFATRQIPGTLLLRTWRLERKYDYLPPKGNERPAFPSATNDRATTTLLVATQGIHSVWPQQSCRKQPCRSATRSRDLWRTLEDGAPLYLAHCPRRGSAETVQPCDGCSCEYRFRCAATLNPCRIRRSHHREAYGIRLRVGCTNVYWYPYAPIQYILLFPFTLRQTSLPVLPSLPHRTPHTTPYGYPNSCLSFQLGSSVSSNANTTAVRVGT